MYLKLALALINESFETCDNEIIAAAQRKGWIQPRSLTAPNAWDLTTSGRIAKQGLYNVLSEKIRKSFDA